MRQREQGSSLQTVARLALDFCILWFLANYLVSIALQYTTVASCTIFLSTSSLWTLFFGVLTKVEKFTLTKLLAVLLSLLGIILVSTADLSGSSSSGPSRQQPFLNAFLGDLIALGSATLYGLYTTLLKKYAGSPERTDMLLFFGFVGAFNALTLWPGLVILNETGIEPFKMPPTRRGWIILLVRTVDHAEVPTTDHMALAVKLLGVSYVRHVCFNLPREVVDILMSLVVGHLRPCCRRRYS